MAGGTGRTITVYPVPALILTWIKSVSAQRDARPTHTVFNGTHNGMVKNPLLAKSGERVRLHVLNVGPSKTSSFHVVGTIFDRVWFEGNPDNQFRGMQTVLLGSSNAATVEFIIPEDGSYIMVDHHFANASQGAIGLVSTTARPPAKDLEHHNISPTRTPTEPDAIAGKQAFESKCLACHSVGEGKKLGPDADAKAMLKEYNNIPMPNQNLTDTEIRQYLKYFDWIDAQPAGTAKAHGAH